MTESRTSQHNLVTLLALCGVAAPIIFAILLTVAGVVYEGYSHVAQSISELGGVEAQYPSIQNTNFLIIGMLVLAFALGLHRGMSEGKGSVLGPLLLGLFGASFAPQALFRCDPGCEFETWTGTMHNLAGLGGFLAAIAGMILISRRARENPRWRAFRGFSLFMGIATLLALMTWIGVSGAAGIESVNGILQRVLAGVLLLWIKVMAVKMFWLSREYRFIQSTKLPKDVAIKEGALSKTGSVGGSASTSNILEAKPDAPARSSR